MKILFIGSAKSSKFLLKKCFDLKLDVVGVCAKKESNNDDFCDLKKYFKLSDNLSIYAKDINSYKSYTWIKNKKPDYIFCFGWSQILKKKIIKLAKIMTIGFHPTELPKNRGKHPIIWSIILGLKKTASTFFVIKDEKVDVGKILSQKKFLIKKFDDSLSLYNKIIKISSSQLEDIVKKIQTGKSVEFFTKGRSNYWRKRKIEDGIIDWRMSANSIYNLVRALSSPYTNAYFYFKNKKIKVLKAKIVKSKNFSNIAHFEPGKIIKKEKFFFDVKCGEGVIRILKIDSVINFKLNEYL